MPEIRPLERSDLPQVASLYELVARSGSRTPPPALESYFEETFLSPPNADSDLPSLVYVEGDGRIVGFLGSSARRLLYEGRPVCLAVSGQLVTDPQVRARAAGAFLLKEFMEGPQDLTVTDTASETIRRIWEGLGGETSQLACVGWVRVFRPWRFAGHRAARTPQRERLIRTGAPLWRALDALSVRAAGGFLHPRRPEGFSVALTSQTLTEQPAVLLSAFRLRPDYGEEFAAWLLGALSNVKTRGELVARQVLTRDEQLQGWFVYYLRSGGIAQVLQVVADGRGTEGVLDHLFHDAYARGASAIQGRVDAHLRGPLAARRCVFHASGYLALLHSRDQGILHTIQSGRAFLTRLESEWWMGHHLEPFGGEWIGVP